jgi:hypothetical protein
LSVVGTAAMFLVGGGILVHGIPPLHHAVEAFAHGLGGSGGFGGTLRVVVQTALEGLAGIVAGGVVLGVVLAAKRLFGKRAAAAPT